MRESFLQLMRGESPDGIVWTADISYFIFGRCYRGDGDPGWESELGHLKLARDLGTMPFYWYDNFFLTKPVYDDRIEVVQTTEGRRKICTWTTPTGPLRMETVFTEASCSEAIVKYPVETEGDLKSLICLLEHRKLIPDHLDDFHRRMEMWAEYDGVPAAGMPRSPLPAFFVEWAGVQHGVYLMMDYPDLVGRVLELLEEQELPIVEAICETKPPVLHFPDNLTSETFTSFFDQYMADAYRRRFEAFHDAGIACAVHLDGVVRGLLPKLAEVGFDAVEAVTPAPVGDVPLDEMRELAGNDNVVLWGGVPGAMFAPPFTWADMKQHVEKLLDCWEGTRFVVGVADQVPPDGDIDMCRKIAQLIQERQH